MSGGLSLVKGLGGSIRGGGGGGGGADAAVLSVEVALAAPAVVEVFTVASVNVMQSRFTISRMSRTMVVITRIKLVTSRLLLKLEITLMVMVLRF